MSMKPFAKTFNIPLGQKVFQSQQLLQTMNQIMQSNYQIMQGEQQIMAQRLMRQYEIQNRLKRLQKQHEEFTDQKQSRIKYKMEKSEKNRHQFLQKIVKRCKDKQKCYNQKIKSYTSKRKQSLRDAWKAATKFNQKILQSKSVRHKSFERHSKVQKSIQEQNLNQSVVLPDYIDQENKSFGHLQVPTSQLKNNSKVIDSALANRSLLKSFDHVVFQSTFNIEKNSSRLPKAINAQSQKMLTGQKMNHTEQDNPQNPYNQKIRKTLIRHQQYMIDEQNKKIQEYGQRLQKITLSRRKKDQLHKSRIKRDSIQNDGYYDQNDKKQSKGTKKNNQRVKSESHTCQKIKRATDFSEYNKQRRQRMLSEHIQHGNQYLSENKIRHLKELMSKGLAYNALEKKLYIERFKHM